MLCWQVSRRVSDAHVKDEDAATGRRKPSSPTKRRKIEHDSSLNLFEVNEFLHAWYAFFFLSRMQLRITKRFFLFAFLRLKVNGEFSARSLVGFFWAVLCFCQVKHCNSSYVMSLEWTGN